MRRSDRLSAKPKLNFKTFSQTGEKVSTSINDLSKLMRSIKIDDMTESEISFKKLSLQHNSLASDIDDFIDENALNELSSANDIERSIEKIDELRSKYRFQNLELKSISEDYDETFGKEFEMRLLNIKRFKQAANLLKSNLRVRETNNKLAFSKFNERKFSFMLTDVNRMISDVFQQIDVEQCSISDSELLSKKG